MSDEKPELLGLDDSLSQAFATVLGEIFGLLAWPWKGTPQIKHDQLVLPIGAQGVEIVESETPTMGGFTETTPTSGRSEPWQQPLKMSPVPQLSGQNGSNMNQTHHKDTPILRSVWTEKNLSNHKSLDVLTYWYTAPDLTEDDPFQLSLQRRSRCQT